MSNVSYAQNYEDVMLLRALAGVQRGFYIDVGAQDPVNDSVTKMFYERGWHGINIEPVWHWYERLLADRPHDINLQLAVSDGPGQLHLFEVVDSGLSTTDPEFAQRHAQAGFRIRESDVNCVTLDHICETHEVRDVHFLKIDCEGAETAALRGISLNRIRPWIILLEATEPNSQKPAYAEWEPLLLQRGYQFAYADGLNRFYVADEHAELLGAFAYPPNVFDKFIRAPEAAADEHLREVQGHLAIAIDAQHMARLHAENERREAALAELRRVLEEHECMRAQSNNALTRVNEALARANEELTQANEMMRNGADEVRRLHDEARLRAPQIDSLRHEIAASEQEVGRLHYAVEARNQEIGRLHYAVADRDKEIARLNAILQAVYRSHSWRVTAPLRVLRHAPRLIHGVRGAAYQLLRRPAHLAKPLLREVVQWSWLRSSLVAITGRDSKIVVKARLFLFGAPPAAQVVRAMHSEASMTRSAIAVLEVIEQVKKQK